MNDSKLGKIGRDDSVTVVVNCDEWTITFYKNDILHVEPCKMEKDKIYHPALTVWQARNVTLKLTETTVDIVHYLIS